MTLHFRKAQLDDVVNLHHLIAVSARALATNDYSSAQIEAALGTVWGVDEELIKDQTYFVAVSGHGHLVACGGWSKRKKLFGASTMNLSSPLLDPECDSARIRAFFVHPDFTRQGIGREIIRLCEDEARQAKFKKIELMGTLPGYRLYKACGYLGQDIISVPCGDTGYAHDCVPMYKNLLT